MVMVRPGGQDTEQRGLLQELRDRSKFGEVRLGPFGIDAMIYVVMDQDSFRVAHGLLDGLELLRDIEAGLAPLDHVDHGAKMAVRSFKPRDERWVTCMFVRFCHI